MPPPAPISPPQPQRRHRPRSLSSPKVSRTPQRHGVESEHHKFIPVTTVQQARQQNLVRFLLLFIVIYFPLSWRSSHSVSSSTLTSDTHDFNSNDWIERATSRGVALYDYRGKRKRATNKAAKITPLRGTVVCDVHISELMGTLMDIEKSKKWVKDLHSVAEYDANNLDGTLLQRYRIWLGLGFIADRELLIRRSVKKNNFLKTVTMTYESIEDSRFPVCKRCVRSTTEKTVWTFKALKGRRTAIDLQAFVDPGGRIPSGFVNWIQRTWPAETLSRLVKASGGKGIQKHRQFTKW